VHQWESLSMLLRLAVPPTQPCRQSASAHELDLPNTLLLTRNLLVAAWRVQGLVSLRGSSQH
jgi:hypothetical protein